MLVLSRRESQSIEFPALGIRVEVLRCGSNAIRLGIDAPRDIRVLRSELAEGKLPLDHDNFQAAISPRRTFDTVSYQLQRQLDEAFLTLSQLRSICDDAGTADDEAALEGFLTQLHQIDAKASLADMAEENRKVRALLVDDNDNESKLLAGYLRVKGFEVETAINGKEAIDKLSTQNSDVVLLDMTMPEFDGRWTIDQIRRSEDLERLTVFAVSGKCPSESDVQVGPSGVNAWFRKPLNPERLATEIQKSIETAVAS